MGGDGFPYPVAQPGNFAAERMQTVAGQGDAERALLLEVSRSVAASAKGGLHGERIVSVLVRLLAQEERLLAAQRANERSY